MLVFLSLLVCCVCEQQFAGLLPELVAAEVFRDEGTSVFAKMFSAALRSRLPCLGESAGQVTTTARRVFGSSKFENFVGGAAAGNHLEALAGRICFLALRF